MALPLTNTQRRGVTMDFFEGQFRKMLWGDDTIRSPFYVDGVCFGEWGNDYLVQMQFIASKVEDEFDALEIVVVCRIDSQQNTFNIQLKDILGRIIILSHSGYSHEAIPCWFNVKTNSSKGSNTFTIPNRCSTIWVF